MFDATIATDLPKPAFYAELEQQARALLAGESNQVANAANFSALLYHAMPLLNWAGFYFLIDGELVVGPFQGKPACVRIAIGRGVCGTAAATKQTQLVPDVHAFADHIACDAASQSEIVIPLITRAGELLGVLDLDSPVPARFDEEDRKGLEALARVFVESIDGSLR
ncbi:GAF domain-containing protein [Paraburkholderia solisilvae]|uniref:Free methionine-R-sulfoxide reductase n=1 Tax=Paraburkholderia solisilvae TaxID=624376 RepID=A0A6J5DGF9_9BURK|nr:GAF domain-containing protein [Paraburkholderia solisilvae]CAB3752252.1 Free methionine-R-sulfoxide reductase [Paraburkholderia solisilvae]